MMEASSEDKHLLCGKIETEMLMFDIFWEKYDDVTLTQLKVIIYTHILLNHVDKAI